MGKYQNKGELMVDTSSKEPDNSKTKVLVYMRVSKKVGMTVENQRPPIERWLEYQRINMNNVTWMIEEESTRKTREVQEKSYELLCNGIYDWLVCLRLDRWGRSTKDLCDTVLNMVENYRRRVIFIESGIDLTNDSINSASKLMLRIMSSFAEYERDLIRERTMEGLETAAKDGKYGGRPKGSKDTKLRPKGGYYKAWEKRKVREKELKKAMNNRKNEKLSE